MADMIHGVVYDRSSEWYGVAEEVLQVVSDYKFAVAAIPIPVKEITLVQDTNVVDQVEFLHEIERA